MPEPLTVDDILLARWRASGLPSRTPAAAAATAAEQVRRLGGVQAQEFELTLWSLAQRTGEPRGAVLDAYADGDIMRTHALRQTWHFVHRDDLPLVQAATADRVHRVNALQYRQFGLDATTLDAAAKVIDSALSSGPATRRELGARLTEAGVAASGQRLGILMMWAELQLLVASGPMKGNQHTYATWTDRDLPDRDEARVQLARAFLTSHGPSTAEDFAAWSSLTKTQARDALTAQPVQRATVAGRDLLWVGDLDVEPWASPQVTLLNGYDEYVSGLETRGKSWLDGASLYRERLGTPVALLMVDGQLAGHWRRDRRGSRLEVSALLLRRFTRAERDALAAEADSYGAFVGADQTTVSLIT